MARRRPRGLLLSYLLMVAVCLVAFGLYLGEARRLVGANYTAMVTDLVRAQEDPDRLQLILDSLLDSPDRIHLSQLNELLWRIPLRIQGLRRHLVRSELEPEHYAPFLDELEYVESRLPELEQAIAHVGGDDDLTLQEGRRLRELGMDLEEALAWSYSELNEVLHQASADQRRLMQRLTLAVAVLLLMLLGAVGGVLLMLYRLYEQSDTMRRLSLTDQLTGLNNRRRLLQEAEQAFSRYERQGSHLTLLLLDLDHFKHINDTYGHPLGDEVLVHFASALRNCARSMEVIARMGGEEFAILMPDSDIAAARRLGERIQQAVRDMPLPEPANGDSLTVSIGCDEAKEGDDFEKLYARADRRLYRAKELGRDRLEGSFDHPLPASYSAAAH
ncbi:GGDEF domain-containing protein [Halomonas sp. TRM85114]|uniref:GGDEF domain-containing protein n=1 Tax=Halomonas jincaotanensis TaxID=2810616 RepID=UPI001BD3421B|nr:GGDEF domain-containing protein [Halomonas jincaotanensis]MBS9404290.1 GGDEF domain-containing protein [Halomonas jincaotanensis]